MGTKLLVQRRNSLGGQLSFEGVVMTKVRRFFAASIVLAAVLSFVALIGGGPAMAAGSSSNSKDNPYGLVEPGVLLTGTLTDAPPNVYLKDGKFTGFDNDLLVAVAKKLNLKVEFVGTEFSSLLT